MQRVCRCAFGRNFFFAGETSGESVACVHNTFTAKWTQAQIARLALQIELNGAHSEPILLQLRDARSHIFNFDIGATFRALQRQTFTISSLIWNLCSLLK